MIYLITIVLCQGMCATRLRYTLLTGLPPKPTPLVGAYATPKCFGLRLIRLLHKKRGAWAPNSTSLGSVRSWITGGSLTLLATEVWHYDSEEGV